MPGAAALGGDVVDRRIVQGAARWGGRQMGRGAGGSGPRAGSRGGHAGTRAREDLCYLTLCCPRLEILSRFPARPPVL